jgi:hypothetical protein
VTGPMEDLIEPESPEDWTRLVLDEVDVANKLRDEHERNIPE